MTVWRRILPHCNQVGFAWDAEAIAVAQAVGIVVREVPIEWRHDERSKIRVGRDGASMVFATPAIWRSARRAGAGAASAVPPTAAAGAVPTTGVFEDELAEQLITADRSHWWFRSKAAFAATALRRTGATHGFLVDVGAGAGGVTAMLGWDPERVAVIEAGARLVEHARHVNGLPSVRSPISPLPLATGAVDVVCLFDVIEHLPSTHDALVEARRVLRRGGRLVVHVPAHRWLWSSADVRLGHHRRDDRRTLRRELAGAGFAPILTSHVFSWLVLPVWLERGWRERRPGRRDTAGLGLDRSSFLIDRTAMVLTAIERTLVGRVPLPLGSSLLVVAEAR
jgi:SAM-dependent methyltransferase